MESLRNKDEVTSLELLKEINRYREMEYDYKISNNLKLGKVEERNGKYTELRHDNLINIIKDEFEEEINALKILEVTYKDKKGELRPMFVLTLEQCKQVLMRESKFVRKGVLEYIHKLEEYIKNTQSSIDSKVYNLRSEELLIKKAELLKDIAESIGNDLYRKTLLIKSSNMIAGENILELPSVENHTYSATEISDMLFNKYGLRVTIQKLGRISNKYNLKIDKYGKFFYDKAKFSNKQVETFKYYDNVVEVFYNILEGENNEKY